MKSEKHHASGADSDKNNVNVEDLFDDEEWRGQAENPRVLEGLGRRLDESLSSDVQGLRAYIDDLKLAYEMVRSPDFALQKETRLVLIIALLYIVSPIDLIPDAIPFIGLLDDIVVAGYAMKKTAAELERYRQFKQGSP